ncbi:MULTISPECIES: hypothetical protein [Halobacteriaceae]|uniref:hypothetical protein n=1 Tax=Halobacteriaceae TaxID=2236 RepID=UPI0006784C3A|nr:MULTISPECIES: hypothetical protein [Halobacteriaceae]MDR5657855.1 hypothetical protein [Halodesulfurarchaeum sp. HSR-GB]
MPVELLLRSGDTLAVDTEDLERIDEQVQRRGKLALTDDGGKDTVVYAPHVQAARVVSDE